MDTTSKRGRRSYTDNFRRQVVAETYDSGDSVSIVARRHDLNANMVFRWRRKFERESLPARTPPTALIPIEVQPAPVEPSSPGDPGVIEVALRNGDCLSVKGRVDDAALRLVSVVR